MLSSPDGTTYVGPIVMTGEGAYEGLTAIVGFVDFWNDCAVTGYIIEGSIPAPPHPKPASSAITWPKSCLAASRPELPSGALSNASNVGLMATARRSGTVSGTPP
jgi:hypothetical protein